MLKTKRLLSAAGAMLIAAPATATLIEPPEYPSSPPGPDEEIPPGAYLLALGRIVPGDVDFVRAVMPMHADEVIVDIEIRLSNNGGGLMGDVTDAQTTEFQFIELNDVALSAPALSCCDAELLDLYGPVSFGPLIAGDVIDIGITGFPDFDFTGNHNQDFAYEVWTWYIPAPTPTTLLIIAGLLASRRR